jgi:hypothetical protein
MLILFYGINIRDASFTENHKTVTLCGVPMMVKRSVVDPDPHPHQIKIRIRIRIKVISWIRIRINLQMTSEMYGL